MRNGYDPDVYLTDAGEFKIVGDEHGNYTLKKQSPASTFAEATVDKVAAFAEAVVAKLRVGVIEAKKVVVDGVDILKKLNELSDKAEAQEKTTDAQQKYFDQVQQVIELQQKQISELKKTVEELKKR